MKNINQKSINQFLKIFINLTDEEEKLIKERLSSVDLKPGQPLNDLKSLPAGVYLILEGSIRLIGYDEKKEPFSLGIFIKGDLVGTKPLIRGNTDQILTASTKTKCLILPGDLFLDFFEKKKINNLFINKVDCYELLEVATKAQSFSNLSKVDILLGQKKSVIKTI